MGGDRPAMAVTVVLFAFAIRGVCRCRPAPGPIRICLPSCARSACARSRRMRLRSAPPTSRPHSHKPQMVRTSYRTVVRRTARWGSGPPPYRRAATVPACHRPPRRRPFRPVRPVPPTPTRARSPRARGHRTPDPRMPRPRPLIRSGCPPCRWRTRPARRIRSTSRRGHPRHQGGSPGSRPVPCRPGVLPRQQGGSPGSRPVPCRPAARPGGLSRAVPCSRAEPLRPRAAARFPPRPPAPPASTQACSCRAARRIPCTVA